MFWFVVVVVEFLTLTARVRRRCSGDRGSVDHWAVQRVKRESQERGFSA